MLRHGEKTLETDPYFETNPGPVLTTLSIGVEKLYKLTLGVASVVREGKWPASSFMRNTYRHDILKLHQDVLAEIEGQNPPVLAASGFSEVRQDEVIPPLLEALTGYAQMGRFYHLDVLAEDPRRSDQDPHETWQRATFLASNDPEVRPILNAAHQDLRNNEILEHGIQAQGKRLAESVRRLWMVVVTSGETGTWGPKGRRFGSMSSPRPRYLT